jgi:hypothetical protein
MRRATYARHLARLEAANARRDQFFLAGAARILGRAAPGWRTPGARGRHP